MGEPGGTRSVPVRATIFGPWGLQIDSYPAVFGARRSEVPVSSALRVAVKRVRDACRLDGLGHIVDPQQAGAALHRDRQGRE